MFPSQNPPGDTPSGLGRGDAVSCSWNSTSSSSALNEGEDYDLVNMEDDGDHVDVDVFGWGQSFIKTTMIFEKAPWMRVVALPSLPSRYALTR